MRSVTVWVGAALLVSIGSTIWMGIALRQGVQERKSLTASIRTLEAAAAEQRTQLSVARQSSERAQEEFIYYSNLLRDAERQWESAKSTPSAAVWAPLGAATGLRTHETNAHIDSPKAQVDRAIRLLSQAVPLGPATAPPQKAETLRLEFLGVPDGMVILSQQVAYFRGEAYFRPNLTEWIRNNMVVK